MPQLCWPLRPIPICVVFEVVPGSWDCADAIRFAFIFLVSYRRAATLVSTYAHPLKTGSDTRLARKRWLATMRIRLGVPVGTEARPKPGGFPAGWVIVPAIFHPLCGAAIDQRRQHRSSSFHYWTSL